MTPTNQTRLMGDILKVILFIVGASATIAGVGLVIEPSGAWLGMTPDVIRSSPFSTFLLPGLVLAVVIGLGHVTGAVLTANRHRMAPPAAVGLGTCLMVWIAIQTAWTNPHSPLQLALFLVGLVEMSLGARLWVSERQAREAVKPAVVTAETGKVLVAFASKRGGTRGIAEQIAAALRDSGLTVDVCPAHEVESLHGYEAVVIGGALYFFRWHRQACRFVKRYTDALLMRPTWFFSSGPLDDSATERVIPPTATVARLMDRVHAMGHMTFGGRLTADASGMMAKAMAKERAGDWRDPKRIRRWANDIADSIEAGTPPVGAFWAPSSLVRSTPASAH